MAKCGQWAWCSANGKAFKNYLPRDKQYLLSKNIRSQIRASKLEQNTNESKSINVKLEGDDWTCIETDSREDVLDDISSTHDTGKDLSKQSQDSSEEIVDLDAEGCDIEIEQDNVFFFFFFFF